MGQTDERFWVRLLPWRQKNKSESKSTQIIFAPKLAIIRPNGWADAELQLVNRSNCSVWVEEALVTLADLDTVFQTVVPAGGARHKILQNVGPNETLELSLALAIYDAAGRPQGPYSCLVLTNVRYRVFDEWCDVNLEKCRVEMQALTVLGLRSGRWYYQKMEHIKG